MRYVHKKGAGGGPFFVNWRMPYEDLTSAFAAGALPAELSGSS